MSTATHGRKSPGRKRTLCRKRDKKKKKNAHSNLVAPWSTTVTTINSCNTTITSHIVNRIAPWNTATLRGTDDNLRKHTRRMYRPSTEESSNLQLFATSSHFPHTIETSTRLYNKRNGTISTRRKTTVVQRSGTKSKKYSQLFCRSLEHRQTTKNDLRQSTIYYRSIIEEQAKPQKA